MTPAPEPAAPEEAPRSAMPTVALLFSLLGLFCFPLSAAGLVLGVVSLALRRGRRTVAAVAVGLAVAGGLYGARVVWPSFKNFGARAKERECRDDLAQAYRAERDTFARTKRYAISPKQVGFAPGPWRRYAYFFAPEGEVAGSVETMTDASVGVAPSKGIVDERVALSVEQLRAAIPPALAEDLGVHGSCPDACWATLACAGQIDADPGADVWSVSTRERVSQTGEKVPAGEPLHEVDDLDD